MHFDLKQQFKLGQATQALAQDFFLDLQLVLVAGMLVVAPATTEKILTGWRDTVGGWLNDLISLRSCKSRFLLGESSLDFLSGQDEGDENCFAAS